MGGTMGSAFFKVEPTYLPEDLDRAPSLKCLHKAGFVLNSSAMFRVVFA